MLCHLLATRWRSLTSERSNQMCGQAFTIDFWMSPIRPPWIWPTYNTHMQLTLSELLSHAHQLQFQSRNTHTHTYHCIASVTGQYNDVNGWRVVGDTDASILGFIFTVPDKDTERRLAGEAEQCEFTVNRSNRMKKFVLTSNCLVVFSSCCFVVTKPRMSVWKEPVWLVKGEVLRKILFFFSFIIIFWEEDKRR